MKVLLPFLLLLFFFSSETQAQCDQYSPVYSENDSPSSNVSYGEWQPIPIRIGYAYRLIPASHTRYFSDDRIPKGWDMRVPEHAIDLSYAPDVRERWQFGTRFTYRVLQSGSGSLEMSLPTNVQQQFPDPLTFSRKATTFSQDFYSEYAFISLGKYNFRALVHAGLGYTHYRAAAVLSYTDTCGCNQSAFHEKRTSTVMAGTLGVGTQFEFAFVGVKALAGYRLQSRSTFVTPAQFDQWKPAFHPEVFNAEGIPQSSPFSIENMDTQPVESATGQFFVQLTFYFYLGWTYDTLEGLRRRAERKNRH